MILDVLHLRGHGQATRNYQGGAAEKNRTSDPVIHDTTAFAAMGNPCLCLGLSLHRDLATR